MSYIDDNCKILRQRRQCAGGGLMVWGMVMPNGLISILFLEKSFNAQKYVDVLKNFAIPICRLNFRRFLLMHDNASVHTAKVVKDFMAQNDVYTLEWPAKSPDINLMENIWHLMSNEVYKGQQPINLKDLRDKIIKSVNVINSTKRQTISSLYGSIRKRLTKILQTGGNIYNNE